MSEENSMLQSKEISKSSPKCNSKVVDSATLSQCENECHIPMGRTGPLVVKIPVVLSDVEIQVDVEAEIRLEDAALDVKTIDKHIYLTQCKLIPHTNKLFIAGYVQKNIQYSSIDCVDKISISGKIQHTTVNVPFKCATEIKLSKRPIYGKDYKDKQSTLNENMFGKDNKEDSWFHYSKLSEPVYCELEYAKIMETDIYDPKYPIPNTIKDEKPFKELIEKMVIFIRLKVLQNQPVFIPEPNGDVIMLDSHPAGFDRNEDKNSSDIEVGYDPKNGMIGKEVHDNYYEE